jgi:HPt (histidine-containing phosphotransfer) domain-containing protein
LTDAQTTKRSHLQEEQVDSLVAAAGVDGARAIMDAFQRSTVDLLSALAEGVRGGALGEAYKTAHAVKGSAANVGAQLLAETAAAIEKACREGDSARAAEMLGDAQVKFDAFCVHFDAHLAQL